MWIVIYCIGLSLIKWPVVSIYFFLHSGIINKILINFPIFSSFSPLQNQISWIRRRDWHILSSGSQMYTNDERFGILHQPGSNVWTLQIKYVQQRDSGMYECQVSQSIKHFCDVSEICDTVKNVAISKLNFQWTMKTWKDTNWQLLLCDIIFCDRFCCHRRFARFFFYCILVLWENMSYYRRLRP